MRESSRILSGVTGKFMKNVSVKYDSNGVFQKVMPGGYKLWT
jgi:hypothetical protein